MYIYEIIKNKLIFKTKIKKEAPCYPHTLIYLASVAEILSQRQMETSTFLTKVPLTKPGMFLSKFILENQWVYQG